MPGLWALRDGTLEELRAKIEPRWSKRPQRLIHHNITHVEILRWYQRSGLGPGAVLLGMVGAQALSWQFLDRVPPELLAQPGGPVRVTLEHRDSLLKLPRDFGPLTPERLGAMWFSTDSFGRRVLLMRLIEEQVTPARVDDALKMALLDWDHVVRRIASIDARPSPQSLLAGLRAPLAVLDRVAHRPLDLNPWRARRNARYAVLYGLAMRSQEGVAEAIHDAWRSGMTGWSPERDRWLFELAAGEVRGGGSSPHAAGTPEPLSLLDLARLVHHRGQLIDGLGRTARDPFSWLKGAVLTLTPQVEELTDPELAAAATAVQGPRPPRARP